MDMQIDRPSRFLMWAHETFGNVALDPRERALRFTEEAVELAHGCMAKSAGDGEQAPKQEG
jgi:hypothetical protein